jgi:hypothetical protein
VVHGIPNRAVARNHHDRRAIVALLQRVQEDDAVAVGQAPIDQIEIGAAFLALRAKSPQPAPAGSAAAGSAHEPEGV